MRSTPGSLASGKLSGHFTREQSPRSDRGRLSDVGEDFRQRLRNRHLEEPGRLWMNDGLAVREARKMAIRSRPSRVQSHKNRTGCPTIIITRLFSPFCVSRILSPKTILPTIGL